MHVTKYIRFINQPKGIFIKEFPGKRESEIERNLSKIGNNIWSRYKWNLFKTVFINK